MMRTAILVLAAMLTQNARAQTVLASSGSEGNGGGLHWAWTIGEPMIATGTSPAVIVTQGFHQPPADFSTVVVPVTANADWQLFPNPTRDLLRLNTTASEAHHAVVLDALGQHVAMWSGITSTNSWSVDHLASGAYRLQVFDRGNNELRTIPFIVTQ